MNDLLSIRAFGTDDGAGAPYPSFDQTGNLLLFVNETILWQRSAYRPSCFRGRGVSSERLWTLSSSTALTMTDCRLVFSCSKYNTDDESWGGWGIGPMGIALAGLARAFRGFLSAKTRRGTTAAGQLRFEWPASVGLGGRRTSDWTRLFVRWHEEQSQLSLDLPLGTPVSRQVAVLLTSCIARYRLANRHLRRISDDSRDVLNQQAVYPVERATVDGSEYELPGYVRRPTVVRDA